MEKKLAIFLSALLLISVSGCSKENNTPNGGNQASTSKSSGKSGGLNISLDHSYASDKIDIGDNVKYFGTMMELNGGLLIGGYDEKDTETMCLYHFDDGSVTPVALNYPSTLDAMTDCYVQVSYVNAENQLVFIYHASIYDENNEENPYQDLGYTMETYDSDFNLIETKDLKDTFPEDTYFGQIVQDKDSNYYASVYDDSGAQKICIYDKDFKQTGEISGDMQYIEQMFTNQDGKIVVSYYASDGQTHFGFLNPEKKSVDSIDVQGMPQWFNTAFAGKKDYDLFVCDSDSAYGIKLDSGTCEEVINWVNSDFTGDSVSNPIQLEDGRIVLIENDYTSDTSNSSIWVLHERDPKEFENTQLISLATLWMPSELGKAVNQFNRTHTDCRIGVMNYNKYSTEEDPEAGLTQFENDMTSGIVADIICMSYMPYERYANKGLLLDLSDYVSQLSSDEYFTNYFDSLKYGDKIYRIGFSYNVQTLEAKSQYLNGKTKLSLSEFADLTKNLPAGMEVYRDMSKDLAFNLFCTGNLNNFIDLNTGSCSFNSPEFVQLLELCNSYPENAEDSRDSWTEEQWNKFWAEEAYQYINDKTLLHQIYISDLKQYLQDRITYFDKAETTLIGLPTNKENSNGGMFQPDYTLSISANSSVKDQVWEFCQTMLSEEYQESLSWTLPVRKEAFDKAAEKALLPDTYTDEDGNEVEIPLTIYRGDEEVPIDPFTKADTDRIKSYIENITETSYYNEQIYNIVDEEAQKYFSGDQTAQAAADMIQSRASIYLSEQT